MKNDQKKGNKVFLSLVTFVLGFMLAYSYNIAKEEENFDEKNRKDFEWKEENQLRNQLINQQEKNSALQEELYGKQEKVRDYEQKLSHEKEIFFNLAEDADKYRMYLGKVKVKGRGIKVTLEDEEYNPNVDNVNKYIVHEQHIFKVVNELKISGASAIAINGQRLKHNSYIICNGPVITIDGNEYPAPFEISAIGDPDVMESALNIVGGVKDQLVNDHIVFTMEKKSELVFKPIVGERQR
ncbi:uncharacterized protein YlxW (UPF0749 family) [Oikeobacillus pervagus]|uniref:Uncharacterized protein YlxW (UPF0749 family) n=1 Tax=Oikeobacillus pervagus TaxID=1325931 RepID=A0AAJ1SYP1_9BACI|nr:DUF881 domain-containing protein [Oikeobacillus pervagus]MDQ0215245.1 uncharacterized protein YlxW (UPF0749 family) [Oikeobacillus pervagus]